MGKLSIVATPIGNLDDITIRAIKTLFSVDLILCEDTRRTGILLQELESRFAIMFRYMIAKPQLMSYYDEIEEKKLPEVIGMLKDGKNLALVSDAGTPLISDPGFRIVRECVKRGIPVESVPGPSALLAALTSSGLPADTFQFLGYPPEKQGHRLHQFEHIETTNKVIKSTYIYYCAPHKLSQTLTDMMTVFGDIRIVLARELTKVHEEVWQGTITEALSAFHDPKGEFVLLFRLP
jgi:16S rRNA (cytidine1402-2'-O)-methyltransferase